jgi:hypothetical protein
MSTATTTAGTDASNKEFTTLAARAALFKGVPLWRTNPADGAVHFFFRVGGRIHACARLEDVEAALGHIGQVAK